VENVHGTFTVRSRSRFKNERNTVIFLQIFYIFWHANKTILKYSKFFFRKLPKHFSQDNQRAYEGPRNEYFIPMFIIHEYGYFTKNKLTTIFSS